MTASRRQSGEQTGSAGPGLEGQLGFLAAMHEIRFFEEETFRLFTQGAVRGTTHLCIGQEAVAVGACHALREGDTMTCTYRGHGATLAMGAPLEESFAEILGKERGLCRGKGGSMHLADFRVGALGANAIVGHSSRSRTASLSRRGIGAPAPSISASSATARRTSERSTRLLTSPPSGRCR